MFFQKPGALTVFIFFVALIKIFLVKKLHHVSKLTIGYLWTKYGENLFFIMCQEFSIRLDLSAHFLLNNENFKTEVEQSNFVTH